MRNALVQLSLVLLGVTSVHAVKLLQTSSLRAHISPNEATENIWAIQGNDSIRLAGSDGLYYISTLHPGNWRIAIDAKKPYRNASVEAGDIRPGTEMDLGEIRLEK